MTATTFFKPTEDVVFLDDLNVACHIGVSEEERSRPQNLVVSLRLFTDLSIASESDHLQHTIDYSQIADDIQSLVHSSRYRLVEALANAVLFKALSHPKVSKAWVRIRKGSVAGASGVGVEMIRAKNP